MSKLVFFLIELSDRIKHFNIKSKAEENVYIVTCHRGGISNKPPGLQAATRHGASDTLVR